MSGSPRARWAPPDATIEALRAGLFGIALTVGSFLLLLGTLAFVSAMLGSGEVPTVPLVLYAVEAPYWSRSEPEAVLDPGLVVVAVGIAGLAIWLFDCSSRIAT